MLTDFSAGLPCITVGWGIWKVNMGPGGKLTRLQPDTLQILNVKIMDKDECKATLIPNDKRLPDSVICTVVDELNGFCQVIQFQKFF